MKRTARFWRDAQEGSALHFLERGEKKKKKKKSKRN